MKKFEVGQKYHIYMSKYDRESVGTIEVLSRTAKFITYHDDFFGNTRKQKIEEKDGTESIFAFYVGVFASDRV